MANLTYLSFGLLIPKESSRMFPLLRRLTITYFAILSSGNAVKFVLLMTDVIVCIGTKGIGKSSEDEGLSS